MSDHLDLTAFAVQTMQVSDLNQIMPIELSAYEYPWSERNFMDALNAQYSGLLFYQTNSSPKLLGYAVLMKILDEMHLLNFTVAPICQGQGWGKQFLNYLCQWSQTHFVKHILLEVRVSNLKAIHVYQRAGFVQIGERKNYYPAANKQRENALVLIKNIFDHV